MEEKKIGLKEQALKLFKSEGLDISLEQMTGLVNSLTNMGVLSSIADNANWIFNFLRICLKLKLDPELKEIYAIKYGNNFSIVIDYHQYIKRAAMSPNYQGFTTTQIDKDKDGKLLPINQQSLVFSCKPKHWDREYIFEYRMSEGNSGKAEGAIKPQFMLMKTAIKNGLAHCFPEILGVFDSIEQADIAKINAIEVESKIIKKEKENEQL